MQHQAIDGPLERARGPTTVARAEVEPDRERRGVTSAGQRTALRPRPMFASIQA